jgi:hypothetical protein
MIHIDFQGGAHGNYLEFICNIAAGVEVNGLPFNELGASHKKIYTTQKIFYAGHYSFCFTPFASDKIVSIQIDTDDLLPVQQISLLRAGDYNYDNDLLEINTFNKLNNVSYKWVLSTLIDGFFVNQVRQSYNAVKDTSWPDINNINDFKKLPTWIKDECRIQHNLKLLELSSESPDCPRHVLREFFQIGFENPTKMGFIARQRDVVYSESCQLYMFPFSCFYDTNQFLIEIKKLIDWAQLSYNCQDRIIKIHEEFLSRQPYKDSKHKCDNLIEQLFKKNNIVLPKLDLLEEAYINAKLKWNYFK